MGQGKPRFPPQRPLPFRLPVAPGHDRRTAGALALRMRRDTLPAREWG